MKNVSLLFIALILVFTVLCYVVTNNFISSGVVLVFTSLYLFLYANQKIKSIDVYLKRFHSCYSFINTYIISISVQGSLLAAFDSTKITMDKGYIDIVNGISNLNEEERLDYLKKYYDFDIYYLFLSVMKVWIEQGGDIFKIAHYLISEARRKEEYFIKLENITKHKIVELSTLWIFTLLIILVLRFTLNSFYQLITKNLLFQITIVGIFFLLVTSLHFFLTKVITHTTGGASHV